MSERGVYRLAAAVLLQAIQDASSNSIGKRVSALRWMNSNDQSSYSFTFICRVLDRDPEDVRRFCERKAAARRRTYLPFQQAGFQSGFDERLPLAS